VEKNELNYPEGSQEISDLQNKLIAVLNEVPVGAGRVALINLMAGSLSDQGESMEDVAEAAAMFGRVLVEVSLNLHANKEQDEGAA
jgi:hypothetical protein